MILKETSLDDWLMGLAIAQTILVISFTIMTAYITFASMRSFCRHRRAGDPRSKRFAQKSLDERLSALLIQFMVLLGAFFRIRMLSNNLPHDSLSVFIFFSVNTIVSATVARTTFIAWSTYDHIRTEALNEVG